MGVLSIKFFSFSLQLIYETCFDKYLASYMQVKQKVPAGTYIGLNIVSIIVVSFTKTGTG